MSAHEHALSTDDVSGPPHVHHMDPETAYGAAKLGMWLFLATEILLFGGLFAGFALYHWKYFPEFHEASAHLNRKIGGINTIVLLFSSFTAAWAVTAAQLGDNKKVRALLGITLACGLAFLVIKGFEWHHKWEDGLFPGSSSYRLKPAETSAVGSALEWKECEKGSAPNCIEVKFADENFGAQYKSFFGLYYCMTGLHALHVIIGMGLIAFWPLRLSLRNRFSSRYYTPVEIGALYWHLVDLIWIYLFPLLYLVG